MATKTAPRIRMPSAIPTTPSEFMREAIESLLVPVACKLRLGCRPAVQPFRFDQEPFHEQPRRFEETRRLHPRPVGVAREKRLERLAVHAEADRAALREIGPTRRHGLTDQVK